ncbi:MAG TPA: Hint domain-containing homing endonuclease [Patescibacteria group bacterium]|nr:Hint domain-containing homing endonuclease [Patescibacteria group bacterium]
MKKIIAISGTHGCFGKGTLVRMYDGTIKPVELIVVGDVLMGDDSTPRRVLELKDGREDLYEFEYIDGIKHIYNASHELVLQYSQSRKSGATKRSLKKQQLGDIRIITVKNYLKLGKQKQRILCKFNAVIKRAVSSTLAIPPYILGVWLGDGHSAGTRLTNTDEIILNTFKCFAESRNLFFKHVGNTKYTYGITNVRGKGNSFLVDLQKYNLINNKHIPLDYFNASIEQRLSIIAGILDADGHLDQRSKGRYEVKLKSKQLAYDLFYISRSCGIHTTIKKVKCVCTNNGKEGYYYRVNLTRGIDIIPCKLAHKKAVQVKNPQRTTSRVGIRNVTPLGIGTYYGFTLDGNNLFLHADGTVLKNSGKSTIAYSLCTKMKLSGKNAIVLDELARKCPFIINKGAGSHTPRWLTCKQITEELELQDKVDFVIADRSVMDAYCYDLTIHGSNSTMSAYEGVIKDHILNLYKTIYIPNMDMFNFQLADGVRDLDPKFRSDVNTNILNTYNKLNIPYKIIHNIDDIYNDLGL